MFNTKFLNKLIFPSEQIDKIPSSYKDIDIQFKKFVPFNDSTKTLYHCFIPINLPKSFSDEYNKWFEENNRIREIKINVLEVQDVFIVNKIDNSQNADMKYFRIVIKEKYKRYGQIKDVNDNKFLGFLKKGIKICMTNHNHILFGDKQQNIRTNLNSYKEQIHKNNSGKYYKKRVYLKINNIEPSIIINLINNNPKATELVYESSGNKISLDLSFEPYRYLSYSPFGKSYYDDGENYIDIDVNNFVNKVNKFYDQILSYTGKYYLIIPYDNNDKQKIINNTETDRSYIDKKWNTDSSTLNDDIWIDFIKSIGIYGTSKLSINFDILVMIDIINYYIEQKKETMTVKPSMKSLTYASFLDDKLKEELSIDKEDTINDSGLRQKLIKKTYNFLITLTNVVHIDKFVNIMNMICKSEDKISDEQLQKEIKFIWSSDRLLYDIEQSSNDIIKQKSIVDKFINEYSREITNSNYDDISISSRMSISSKLHKLNLLDKKKAFY